MQHTETTSRIDSKPDAPYEVPELTMIGAAGDVILGMPGGGADGPFGKTEPPFEFELDELD
jgi:hypothetical protein